MNLKDKLVLFVKNLSEEDTVSQVGVSTKYSIDKKIDDFIKWYTDNFVTGKYTGVGEFCYPRFMRDSIEKMAVWYELKYPEYEINRLINGMGQENISVDNIYVRDNKILNNMFADLDVESELAQIALSEIHFKDILSFDNYLEALPFAEKWFLLDPRSKSKFYLNDFDYVELDAEGFVKKSNGDSALDFSGWHIKDVLKYLNLVLDYNLEYTDVENYTLKLELKEKFLDAVMLRIIERGGNRLGPRRGFIFAKEFDRNIEIPLIYGIDLTDPGLRNFINLYIKAGGRSDLECLCYYGFRKSNSEPLEIISVKKLLETVNANCIDKYTKEETLLHQKLVDWLLFKIELEKVSNSTDKQRIRKK